MKVDVGGIGDIREGRAPIGGFEKVKGTEIDGIRIARVYIDGHVIVQARAGEHSNAGGGHLRPGLPTVRTLENAE